MTLPPQGTYCSHRFKSGNPTHPGHHSAPPVGYYLRARIMADTTTRLVRWYVCAEHALGALRNGHVVRPLD